MTDLEGLARRKLLKGFSRKGIVDDLTREILEYKEIKKSKAEKLAIAILDEVDNTLHRTDDSLLNSLLSYPESNVTMDKIGVGCRGEGDFIIHRMIGDLASSEVKSFISPSEQDDSGAVKDGNRFIVVAVDGTHSRLSEYPFLAGFHVARASLRDVYVNGAKPVALFNDIHLADDGDIGKIFDFVAGINAISQLTEVPLIAGSTLRVGGDMVIGDRMVSGAGAVGVAGSADKITARRNVKPRDKILMTKGAGGGTICTAAIYSGNFGIIKETLNIDFIKACKAILKKGLGRKIRAMLDVTNGGLRGDSNEVCKTAKVGLVFYYDKVRESINPRVYEMLEKLRINPLGVSLDSLLIFAPPEHVEEIVKTVERAGVQINLVGEVIEKPRQAFIVKKGKKEKLEPLFRESAYTKIKKLKGESKQADLEEMKNLVAEAYKRAVRKRDKVIRHVKSKG